MNDITPTIYSEQHKAARELAKAGIPAFAVEVNGKRPLPGSSGFYDATTDLRTIDEKWAENPEYNVAFATGEKSNLFVIDFDPGSDASFLNLPKTYTVATPRGGRHYIYYDAEGTAPSTSNKLGPHIDTRGVGGYALAAPSEINGNKYVVIDDRDPVPLPNNIRDLLEQKECEKRHADENLVLDTQANIQRTVDYLSNEKPGIEYQGSDAFTFKVACRVKDLGVSLEKGVELAVIHWLPRCEGTWDEDYLRTKFENAYSYGQNEPGCDVPKPTKEVFWEAIKNITDDEVQKINNAVFNQVQSDKKYLKPLSLSDLLTRTVPPIEEIIPGLVEKGIATFLSAPGGSHKSRLALQLGLCVGTGSKVFGRTVTPATFIYLSYEDHSDEVTRRAQAIAKRLKLPSDGNIQYMDLTLSAPALVIVNEQGFELRPFWHELKAHLLSISGPKFLVIDSTYNALQFQGQAKINESSVKAAIELLNRLCVETDTTIVALWHPSQAGQERGDASGWSVAWHNTPRARLSLSALKETQGAYELKCEKRNNGPKGEPVTLHWDEGALLPDNELGEAKIESRLLDACVEVAIEAANSGQPISAQKHPQKWVIDEIEKRASYRPSNRRVKEELARALHLGRLRYVKGSNKHTAGYYPSDFYEADKLARQNRNACSGDGKAPDA